MFQITFFLLFVFILTTGCVKDLDFNPSTSIIKYLIQNDKKTSTKD